MSACDNCAGAEETFSRLCESCVQDQLSDEAAVHSERDHLRAEVERLKAERDDLQQDCEDQHALTDRMMSERDAARAEVERLRGALIHLRDSAQLGPTPSLRAVADAALSEREVTQTSGVKPTCIECRWDAQWEGEFCSPRCRDAAAKRQEAALNE